MDLLDPRAATAEAPSNIALVKYWGKRDDALNLPSTGSLSVTLDSLRTRTAVRFAPELDADRIRLDGRVAAARATRRIVRFLDLVRLLAGTDDRAEVVSENGFPTGAGLASSASGFAALALACDEALGLGYTPSELSALARRGSGSAARSLFGGFVEMVCGEREDGRDTVARPFLPADHLPMAIVVAVTSTEAKATGSTEGMRCSARTSPFFDAWTKQVPHDLERMRSALQAADLERVGEIAEENCARMHAVALGAAPPLLYWNAATVEVIRTVEELRRSGTGAWFTIDAGPQVKVLCAPGDSARVTSKLRAVPGVLDVLRAAPGAGARIVGSVPS